VEWVECVDEAAALVGVIDAIVEGVECIDEEAAVVGVTDALVEEGECIEEVLASELVVNNKLVEVEALI